MGKIKTKVYSIGKKRKLTLAGKVNREDYHPDRIIGIDIAMAIRNPEDDYKRDLGKTIATGRLEHGSDKFIFEGAFDTLRASRSLDYIQGDIVEMQMDVVAEFIKKNLDKFI